MTKNKLQKARKRWRFATIFFAFLVMPLSLCVPAILIVDEVVAGSVTDGASHQYTIQFYNDEDLIYSTTSPRGCRFDYSGLTNPTKNGTYYHYYQFVGWDTTGDGREDILPLVAYRNVVAKAVFAEIYPYGR